MEQNTNETIAGEFTDQEEAPIKKKIVISPKLKKALGIGAIVIGTAVLTAAATMRKDPICKYIERDDVEIEMVTNPDGTETWTISEVRTTTNTDEEN